MEEDEDKEELRDSMRDTLLDDEAQYVDHEEEEDRLDELLMNFTKQNPDELSARNVNRTIKMSKTIRSQGFSIKNPFGIDRMRMDTEYDEPFDPNR